MQPSDPQPSDPADPVPKVPNPVFHSVRDIKLYTLFTQGQWGARVVVSTELRGSSLAGQRLIADFFDVLDYYIEAGNADYKLTRLDDERHPLADPPLERSSPGEIMAGSYLIVPAVEVEGAKIMFKPIDRGFDSHVEGTDSPSPSGRGAKRAKREGEESTASERSGRDPSDHSQSFKMRLVYRDKGCAVCLAAGIQDTYKFSEDSYLFEGAHIIGMAYHERWDTEGFSALVSDPYTDPRNSDYPFVSPTTRNGNDSRRMNSLENGILLCSQHHKQYDHFHFTINASTHKIFSFHPATLKLHGIEVKAPWDCQDVLFPPPHPRFLELHHFTSITRNMKGSGGYNELDDDDEDYEELSELEEVQSERNEKVRIWRNGCEATPSSDFAAGTKGGLEILANFQGIVSV